MANEAVCLETPTRFTRLTCAEATTIPKGTILKLTTPNTGIASAADSDPFAGIAWMEKLTGDGSTEIVAALDGVWSILTTNAAITAGMPVSIAAANTVAFATAADLLVGTTLGKALETCAANVRIKVRVGSVI